MAAINTLKIAEALVMAHGPDADCVAERVIQGLHAANDEETASIWIDVLKAIRDLDVVGWGQPIPDKGGPGDSEPRN